MMGNDIDVNVSNQIQAVLAKYNEAELPEYKGNPLIEALPPIFSGEQIMRALSSYPKHYEDEKDLDSHVRYHCIQRLFRYFQPLSCHIDIHQRICRLIRQGYLSRNPIKPQYAKSLQNIYEMVKEGDFSFKNSEIATTTAAGLTIIGYSGMGKSTVIEKVLNQYPQIIIHEDYKGQDINQYQLTWLKLDCPFDGSVKGLCINFFNEFDRLLNDNSYKKYASGRNASANALIPRMALLARRHSLGLLVIDEIQHLSLAKSGGREKMLNFFVNLVNIIGVPVVLIGTNKAYSVLQSEFRQARRGSGQGDMIWERMKNDEEWAVLIKGMWKYQWTKNKIPYTKELKDVLYEESQGIIDIAVKLYAMTQMRAIAIGREVITPQLIRVVAKDSLQLVKPMLQALKSGDKKLIHKYGDISPINIDEYCDRQKKEMRVNESLKYARKQYEETEDIIDTAQKALIILIGLGIEETKAKESLKAALAANKSYTNASEIAREAAKIALQVEDTEGKKTRKRVKADNKVLESDDLRFIVESNKKKGKTAYEALKEKGVIRNPVEEFKLLG